ncbi:EAL domain-containing protein [Altererythrobacter sp. MF3-039]|uniref:EAL domain-containing protein n=1 Tax=Altererythrobacter sp. MF3-039 TaxID=3252901 RepID=UPI00390CC15D
MAFWSKFRSLNERATDVLWAAIAAALLAFFGLLSPVNQMVWVYQSVLSEDSVSGDIIFATSDESLSNPDNPNQRAGLARTLRQIAQSDVEHVYLDVIYDRPSSTAADTELADAIATLGPRVSVVRRLTTNMSAQVEFQSTLPEIVGDTEQLATVREINYLGFTWRMPFEVERNGISYPTLAGAMAGANESTLDDFPISYDFDPASIPLLDLDRELVDADMESLAGKKVLVGNPATSDLEAAKIPGVLRVPRSYVSLYAAETLKAGYTREYSELTILAIFAVGMLVIFVGLSPRRILRRKIYMLIAIAAPSLMIIGAAFHVRLGLGAAIVFLGWYAALRFRARWQKKFALEDDKTGMPTFRALEKAMSEDQVSVTIVVAKVHGYEDVAKTLPPDLHAQYVRSLVERFRVTEKDMAIYANEGRYFAWTTSQSGREELVSHLDGLRALFASPITVSDTELDAGITFGVDTSSEPNPAQRIASAVSAAERTDEAHQPIIFAVQDSQTDALWKLSLQTRIDNALEREEIYLAYQPKVDIETGEMVGVEALVRWNDPSRGPISPAYFIQECERAGRMDHLTEYVLREAVSAAVTMRGHGINAKMSVNISATLLRDDRVEKMVETILTESNLPPHLLVLEITETARILDLDHAVTVLNRLRNLGIAISIDDFGVGAANLETIYKLPLNEVKIDREFVSNLKDPKAAAVVAAIIVFGEATNTAVVAEGAEDDETIELLAESGCRIVQGYGISRPIDFDSLLRFNWVRPQKPKRIMV